MGAGRAGAGTSGAAGTSGPGMAWVIVARRRAQMVEILKSFMISKTEGGKLECLPDLISKTFFLSFLFFFFL